MFSTTVVQCNEYIYSRPLFFFIQCCSVQNGFGSATDMIGLQSNNDSSEIQAKAISLGSTSALRLLKAAQVNPHMRRDHKACNGYF